MLGRNPDVVALGFVVVLLGGIGALADVSHFVARNLSEDRQQHFERRVELLGERVEEKAAQIERRANQMAERIEQEAQRHAERAERLSKILDK